MRLSVRALAGAVSMLVVAGAVRAQVPSVQVVPRSDQPGSEVTVKPPVKAARAKKRAAHEPCGHKPRERAGARGIRIVPGTYSKGTHSIATATMENGVRVWRLRPPHAAISNDTHTSHARNTTPAPIILPFFVPEPFLPALPLSAAEPYARYGHSFDAYPARIHRHRQHGFGIR